MSDLARDAGLFVYFCLTSVLIVGGAVGFYRLMQPATYPNPGASAASSPGLFPPQVAVEGQGQVFAAKRPAKGTTALASAIEASMGSPGTATQEAGRARKSEHATTSPDKKQKHSMQPKRREPMTARGAQPSFADNRSWGGDQTWDRQRPSGYYQATTDSQPWSSYQGWGAYRNRH